MLCEHCIGGFFHLGQHRLVANQIGDVKGEHPGLACAQQFAGTTQLQITFGDLESVAGFAQGIQSLTGKLGQYTIGWCSARVSNTTATITGVEGGWEREGWEWEGSEWDHG